METTIMALFPPCHNWRYLMREGLGVMGISWLQWPGVSGDGVSAASDDTEGHNQVHVIENELAVRPVAG